MKISPYILIMILLLSCVSSNKRVINHADTLQITEMMKPIKLDSSIYTEEIIESIKEYENISKVNSKLDIQHTIKNIRPVIGRSITNIGQVLYQFPDTMVIYKIYDIVVRISKDTSLTEIVLIDIKKTEEVKRTKIPISSKMVVELKNDIESDPNFTISKINSDSQQIDTTLYNTWYFRVVPIKSGETKLNLVISIINESNKKEVVYSDNIVVRNNIKQKILNWWEIEWKWIFITIIIPLITFFARRYKRTDKDE